MAKRSIPSNRSTALLAFADYREPLEIEIQANPPKAEDAREPSPKDSGPQTKRLQVTLAVWPRELPQDASEGALPITEPAESKAKIATGVVTLPMGDVKNEAFAFIPPTYHPQVPHGLLLVVADPGKIDRKAWVDRWEQFCRDQRFILTCVSSADPRAWSMEELEIIQRTLQKIRSDYAIDSRRIVVHGVGAGGGPAIVIALQKKEFVRGLWLAGGGIPRGLRMPQAEPRESIAILLQGDNPAYESFAEKVDKLGYRAIVSSGKVELIGPGSKSTGQAQAAQFLISLEWH